MCIKILWNVIDDLFIVCILRYYKINNINDDFFIVCIDIIDCMIVGCCYDKDCYYYCLDR